MDRGVHRFLKRPSAETLAARAAGKRRQAEFVRFIESGDLPSGVQTRLEGARRRPCRGPQP
jgi:hypothetical protein